MQLARRPLKPCKKHGCIHLTRTGYCEAHEDLVLEQQRHYNNEVRNQTHKKFYNSKEWQRARQQAIIRDHSFCQACLREGRHTRMNVVDHIIELQDNYALRSTLSNLECLCHPCHNRKTRREQQRRQQQSNRPF